MRDVHTVRTPENVVFEHELAGLTARALGLLIDILVMSTLVGLAALTCAVFGVVLAGFARALYFVALFAIQWGYAVVLEWRWHGQTIGKRIAGTRVLASTGLEISFGQAALRNLLRMVDILPGGYLLGAVSALLDGRGRRLGDIAADTLVVRVERGIRLKEILGDNQRASVSEQDSAWTHATGAMTAPERELLIDLVERREQLPLSVRHDLFAKLAHRLESRLGLSRPEFLSDERFLLNLAANLVSPLASKRPERPHRSSE
jgi:uncharacterized RDD family membrane protein YckC